MQTSLLRVLEEKQITRLGETKPQKIDARVLAATHRNLTDEVTKGNFRSDLLYRLRIARIVLPPLRQRREDIPLLIESFLGQSRAATGKSVETFSDKAMRILLQHDWPGNVRELKSAVSARLINVDTESLDPHIDSVLRELVLSVGTDISAIWLLNETTGAVNLAHLWDKEGIDQPENELQKDDFPYLRQLITGGKAVFIEQVVERAEISDRHRKFFQRLGIKSALIVPLVAQNIILGAMFFASKKLANQWPCEVVHKLEISAKFFTNVFLRRRKENELKRLLEENVELRRRLEEENKLLHHDIIEAQGFSKIVAESKVMHRLMAKVEQVARTDSTVLILGETGTGKNRFANYIHKKSLRQSQSVIHVNCASLPESLIESELFGYEKGAFTGAVARKMGRFELAHKGTLILDEIGEIPLTLQAKLLHAIEYGEFQRLGSEKNITMDVRIIAITNRDLKIMVKEGLFRSDLYYRLHVFPITVPPLRERKEDIPSLVKYLIGQLQGRVNRKVTHIDDDSLEHLISYDWPGNIRELKNVLERSLILTTGPNLIVEKLTDSPKENMVTLPSCSNINLEQVEPLDEITRRYIQMVCTACDWRIHGKGNAADRLGINPNTLRSRMKKLGIERPAKGN